MKKGEIKLTAVRKGEITRRDKPLSAARSGEIIRSIRQDAGLTLVAVSERLSLATGRETCPAAIHRIETGLRLAQVERTDAHLRTMGYRLAIVKL